MTATTFAIISLLSTAVSAGVSYNSQRQQAKASEAAAAYNAKLSRNAAQQEAAVAAENARREREVKRRRLSSIRANAAGRGVSFAGSVAEQLDDSAFILERNVQSRLYSSQMKQRGLESGANMALFEGSLKADAHRTNANAALLQGVTDVAGDLYGGFDRGVFKMG